MYFRSRISFSELRKSCVLRFSQLFNRGLSFLFWLIFCCMLPCCMLPVAFISSNQDDDNKIMYFRSGILKRSFSELRKSCVLRFLHLFVREYTSARWKTETMKEVKKQWRSHYPAAKNIPNTPEAEDEWVVLVITWSYLMKTVGFLKQCYCQCTTMLPVAYNKTTNQKRKLNS